MVTGNSGQFMLLPSPTLNPGVEILDEAAKAKPPVTVPSSEEVTNDFILPPPSLPGFEKK